MSDLNISKDAVAGAMAAIREGKPDLLQAYRRQHEETGCCVVTYKPEPASLGRLPLLADARCDLCKSYDSKVSSGT